MKKTLTISGLLFSLLIIEIFISFLFGSIYSIFRQNGNITIMLSDLAFLGIYRIVFSFIISIFLFYLFNRMIQIENKISKLTLINLLCLVITTLLYSLFSSNGFEIIFRDWYPLNLFIFLSTICSPIIIINIPCFKTVINNFFDCNG